MLITLEPHDQLFCYLRILHLLGKFCLWDAKFLFQRVPGCNTRDVFYVRREVDLMKTAKVNAYIMHIFGKIELLSIYAT